jgi:hypothetical protein
LASTTNGPASTLPLFITLTLIPEVSVTAQPPVQPGGELTTEEMIKSGNEPVRAVGVMVGVVVPGVAVRVLVAVGLPPAHGPVISKCPNCLPS